MMRLEAMLGRLPPVYDVRPNALLRRILAPFALALAAFDEDMDRVQRAHWVDTAFALEDLARIGALFGIRPAGWEGLELFRARLKAMIAARLKGAVTLDAIEYVVLQILAGVRAELGDIYLALPGRLGFGERILARAERHAGPRGGLVEYPLQRCRSADLAGAAALLRPLAQLSLVNRGLDPAPLLGRISGVAGRRTAVPTLVNLTTGGVLLYAGLLACGQSLALGRDAAGNLTGRIGDRDVSDRLWTGEGFVPGARFQPLIPDPAPRPLMLARGPNLIWFFPLGLHDARGLDSAVFATPDADLRHGRFGDPDGTAFDKSLFEQGPAVSLDLHWDEARPAAFRVEIPAGAVLRPPSGAGRDAETDRAQLFQLLEEVVDSLRAAGVDGQVTALPLRSEQRLGSQARMLHPDDRREMQQMESVLAGVSALFDTTAVTGARLE